MAASAESVSRRTSEIVIAIGLAGLALFLRYGISYELHADTSFTFGVCAVLGAALLSSSTIPPLFSILTVAIGWSLLFAGESPAGGLHSAQDFVPLARFTGICLLIVAFQNALRRVEAALRRSNELLEHRVHERTAELEMRGEQLRALARDLAEAESRERKRMAQLLHDHFQQLVSAAKMKVGIIRRRCQDEALIEPLRHTEDLLDQVLVSSRNLATELSPPVLYDVGLGPAVEWLARNMEKNHNLVVHLDLERLSEPDNEQVRTIIFECARELLFNTVKHAGVNSAQLKAWSPGDGLLHLSVIDKGRGFDAQQSEWRASAAGSFGLFSLRERLSVVGGQLTIQSSSGQGTVANITVPAISQPKNGQKVEPVRLPDTVNADDPSGVFRILVADDHKLFRESLVSLLEQKPYLTIVGEAGDGQEAIDMARKLRPDIMIVDVTMPKLNGVQVTSMLSKEFPQLKIIGLSMHESQDLASAMRAAGAAAYCAKSAPVESLIGILRAAALDTGADHLPAN